MRTEQNNIFASSSTDSEVHRRGFTLIEVLVVVAIITLLVAVLIPSLRRAREQSRLVSCQSNLKQIVYGWHSYLDESQGRFLQRVRANINYGGIQGMDPLYRVPKPLNKHLALPKTTRDGKVFRCPDDLGTALYRPTCFDYLGTSYMTNIMMVGDNQLLTLPTDPCNQPPSSPDTLLKQVNKRIKKLNRNIVTTNYSRLVLLGDFGWVNAWNFQTGLDLSEWHDRAYSYNLGFMDGHAEFVRIRKGMHVTSKYTVIPFKDLFDDAIGCQQEVMP